MKKSMTGYVSPTIAEEFKLIAKEQMMSISHMIERYIECVVENHRAQKAYWVECESGQKTPISTKEVKNLAQKIDEAMMEHASDQAKRFTSTTDALDFLDNDY